MMISRKCDTLTRVYNFAADVATLLPKTTNRKVVYTANFGGYDHIAEPIQAELGVDYLYFTDSRNVSSKIWRVIVLDRSQFDPRTAARVIKHLPHVILCKYKVSLWLDARISSKRYPVNFLFDLLGDDLFFVFRHPRRRRVFSEAIACVRNGHDFSSVIFRQYLNYRLGGFPDEFELAETGVLLRDHSHPSVKRFQEFWLKQICDGSIRDQLSFNYSVWKSEFGFKFFEGYLTDVFELRSHSKEGIYSGVTLKIPLQRRLRNFLKRVAKN